MPNEVASVCRAIAPRFIASCVFEQAVCRYPAAAFRSWNDMIEACRLARVSLLPEHNSLTTSGTDAALRLVKAPHLHLSISFSSQ
nr:hypothetical protein [Sphingomonas changnyeongensis]